MDQVIHGLLGVLGGSAFCTFAAKYFISKILKDLENVIEKISEIKTALAEFTIRIEKLDKTYDLIHEIERKVITMEAIIYGKTALSQDSPTKAPTRVR